MSRPRPSGQQISDSRSVRMHNDDEVGVLVYNSGSDSRSSEIESVAVVVVIE